MPGLAFNSYAANYDAHFTHSPIGILQRKRVFKFLFPLLDKTKNVLEINCGTGHDALTIAPNVKQVLATDIAADMIAVAQAKQKRAGIANVEFMTSDIRLLHDRLRTPYDILFSDFGGLNCLDKTELADFAKNSSPFISSGGKLVLVIMGKKCLWENLFFFKQKDKRLKRRNTNEAVETTIDGKVFKTWYYAPGEIGALFEKNFTVKTTKPVGLFIPPSYLNDYFSSRKRLLWLLNVLETMFGSFSFLSNYADHYTIILEKNKQG